MILRRFEVRDTTDGFPLSRHWSRRAAGRRLAWLSVVLDGAPLAVVDRRATSRPGPRWDAPARPGMVAATALVVGVVAVLGVAGVAAAVAIANRVAS